MPDKKIVDRSSGKSEVHGKQNPSQYRPRYAAYDLKKLRGKQIFAASATPAAMNRCQLVCGR
jgi:hypothetical protein